MISAACTENEPDGPQIIRLRDDHALRRKLLKQRSEELFWRMRMNPRRVFSTLTLSLLLLGLICCTPWLYHRVNVGAFARQGEAEAQYFLGKRYCSGPIQNPTEAVKWLSRAAAQGHSKARTALGQIYAQGVGVHVNHKEALKWFRQGAELGEADAQNQLGMFYAQGKGVSQDLNEAIKWFRRASEQGLDAARENLALAQAARGHVLGEVSTRTGKTYRNASMQKIERDGITVQFTAPKGGFGVAKLRFQDISDDTRLWQGYSSLRPASEVDTSSRLAAIILQPL